MADKTAQGAGGDRPKPGERHNQRRKATLEQMRREQQAKERRKTILYITIASVVALAIIAVTVFAVVQQNAEKNRPINEFGVAASEAGCDPEITEASAEVNNHVGSGVRVDYPSAGPSFGQHDGNSLQGSEIRAFFAVDDTEPVERLVHSLEHGYTLYWYDPTLPQDTIDTIERMAEAMFEQTDRRFIAAPWQGAADNRPAFPEGKRVALAHWGKTNAWRQYCGDVSGEAAQRFSDAHPASDAPEAGAI